MKALIAILFHLFVNLYRWVFPKQITKRTQVYTDKWEKVTVPPGPWTLKNPREPKVQVGTEPTPEEYIKVRWISASHETRSNRLALCGGE